MLNVLRIIKICKDQLIFLRAFLIKMVYIDCMGMLYMGTCSWNYDSPVTEVFTRYRDYLGDTLVIRLLGGDRSEIEKKTGNKWNRIVEEKPIKRDIIQMSVDSKFDHGKVIINVNNHYEGSAPLTISALRHLYEEFRSVSS